MPSLWSLSTMHTGKKRLKIYNDDISASALRYSIANDFLHSSSVGQFR